MSSALLLLADGPEDEAWALTRHAEALFLAGRRRDVVTAAAQAAAMCRRLLQADVEATPDSDTRDRLATDRRVAEWILWQGRRGRES